MSVWSKFDRLGYTYFNATTASNHITKFDVKSTIHSIIIIYQPCNSIYLHEIKMWTKFQLIIFQCSLKRVPWWVYVRTIKVVKSRLDTGFQIIFFSFQFYANDSVSIAWMNLVKKKFIVVLSLYLTYPVISVVFIFSNANMLSTAAINKSYRGLSGAKYFTFNLKEFRLHVNLRAPTINNGFFFVQ